MAKELIKISANEFAKRLKVDSDLPDGRFAFFLGAGCSVSSGIPTAGSLVKNDWLPRLRDLRVPEQKDIDDWAKEQFPDYDSNNPAAVYGPVMGQLFLQQEVRQLEVERLCDGKFPAFGYAVLATLVSQKKGVFNVVLTTNFDEMVPDALYLFTQARPLVIGHESLAGYIRPTRTRPLVIKLHGDFRLSPQNTSAETEIIKQEVERQIANLLHDRGLIVMGYGGNDQGIAKMFKALPKESLPFGIYWVNGSEPQGILRTWLEERNVIWVENSDFDEMMLLIRDAFGLPHPDQKPFEAVFRKYGDMYKILSDRILAKPTTTAETVALKEAIERADKDLSGWLAVYSEASRFEKNDPDKAEEIFNTGLQKLPKSVELLGVYGLFLYKIREDYDKAEEIYKQALDLNPNSAGTLNNYANLLFEIRKDYDRADAFYQRTIGADPNHAIYLGNYAQFLRIARKDYKKANEYFIRSIEANPNNVSNLVNYGSFLEFRKEYENAEKFYRQALEIDENNIFVLSNYASFIKDIQKDYKKAEEFYKRILVTDPNNANNLGNYAGLLFVSGQVQKGIKLLEDAIKLLSTSDPKGLHAEIWFYAFAHFPEVRHRNALRKLKKALLDGDRSPDWDLSGNIAQARKDKHPDIDWLEKLVDVINEKADISILDNWPIWQKA